MSVEKIGSGGAFTIQDAEQLLQQIQSSLTEATQGRKRRNHLTSERDGDLLHLMIDFIEGVPIEEASRKTLEKEISEVRLRVSGDGDQGGATTDREVMSQRKGEQRACRILLEELSKT